LEKKSQKAREYLAKKKKILETITRLKKKNFSFQKKKNLPLQKKKTPLFLKKKHQMKTLWKKQPKL